MDSGFIEVIDPGFFTTVQDAFGRKGYFAVGIPPSGAMDQYSLRMGNLLVKNDQNEAGLELTLIGGKYRFDLDAVIAITGANMMPKLNKEPAPMWHALPVKEGDVLAFGAAAKGCRTYLSIAGGIDVPLVLGSKSTYVRGRLGGFRRRKLEKGDKVPIGLPLAAVEELAGRRVKPELVPEFGGVTELRVVMGPQDDHVSDESLAMFHSTEFKISHKADRMAYRFVGPRFTFKPRPQSDDAGSDPSNIVDDGIPIGGIQLPGGVEPICMGTDGVSAGGFVKIACLIAADMRRMGQVKPGDPVRFVAVSLDQAEEALRELMDVVREENVVKG